MTPIPLGHSEAMVHGGESAEIPARPEEQNAGPRATPESLVRPEDQAARRSFWEGVHSEKDQDGVSWWQSVPELSLGLVDATQIALDQAVIDVGAGWSTLVDHLLDKGFRDLTAVDLSMTALQTVRDRLGAEGSTVVLRVADVLERYGLAELGW